MRIAVDARVLELPCPTGVERAASEIVRALPAALGAADEAFVLSRSPLAAAVLGGALPADARVRYAALDGPEAPLVWRETHLAPALSELRSDVLWSPVAALPVRTDVPRVATFHEAPWLVRPGIEGGLRERAHRIRLRIAARVAARIVVPSAATAAQLAALHPAATGRVRVVPHGVPERFLAPRKEALADAARAALGIAAPYLLQVGGTRARKNVPFLLRAYARYRLRGGRSSLVIAGPGPTLERVPRGVFHLGWVDDSSLLALYDGATAVAVSSECEGFGLPVVEAMARGTPVVAVATGGVPEAAGDAALLVRPGDEEAFATALLRIEQDPVVRMLLRERGARRASACRFAASAARLVDVLREAAAS